MRLRALLFTGIMAGLAALLQTAPVWLGQPAGFALAVLACLPLALAAAVELRSAALSLLVAALLCALVQPEEGWVFGLTNGPFGLALGAAARRGDRVGWGFLLPALALFGGVTLLTWGVGFPALGPEVPGYGLPVALLIYALFSLLWSALFAPLALLLIRRTRAATERWTDLTPPQ